MSSSDLMNVKHDFTSLIQEVQPWILSHFVMWLDLKVAEFKVYGYMILDQTSESQHAQINDHPIRRADGKLVTKQIVRSDPDVTIIPRSKVNSSASGIRQNTNLANKRNAEMVPMVKQTNKETDNCNSNSNRYDGKVNDIENIVTLHMDGIHNNITHSNKASLIESFDKQTKNQSESEHISNTQSDCNMRKKNQSESVQSGMDQSDCMNVSGDIESCYRQDNNLPLYKSLQFNKVISNNPRNKYRNIDDGLQILTANESLVTTNRTANPQLCVEDNTEYQSQQLDNLQRYQPMKSTNTNQYAEKDSVNHVTSVDHVTSDLSLDESTGTVVKIEDDTDYDQFNCSTRVVSPDKDGQDRSFSSSSDISYVANQSTNEDSMVYSGTSTVSDGMSLYLVCTDQEGGALSAGSPFGYSDGISKNQFNRKAINHSSKWKKWIDPESGKYKCSQCNKLFVNRSSFYRHKRLHGEKRFHCYMCDKAFHRSEHLRIHIRRHGRIDSFHCHNCNTQCENLQTYQEHVEQCVFITDNQEHMQVEQWSSTAEGNGDGSVSTIIS